MITKSRAATKSFRVQRPLILRLLKGSRKELFGNIIKEPSSLHRFSPGKNIFLRECMLAEARHKYFTY